MSTPLVAAAKGRSKDMSAHDRAAVLHARRFTLTVCKSDPGAVQSWEISRLTEREVETQKAYYRELYVYPGSPYALGFDVETA
jgi:hypothetical protein